MPQNILFRNFITPIVKNPLTPPLIDSRPGGRDGTRSGNGGGGLPPLERPLAASFAAVGFGFKGHFNMPGLPTDVAGSQTQGSRFTISPDGQRLYFRGSNNNYTYVNVADVGQDAILPLPPIDTYGQFRLTNGAWGRPVGGAIISGVLYMPFITTYDTGNDMAGRVLIGYDPDTLEQITGTARAQYAGSLLNFKSYDDGTQRDLFTTRKVVGPLAAFPPEWADVFGYPCYMTPGTGHSITNNSNLRHGFTLVNPTQLVTNELLGYQDIDVKPVLYSGGPQGADRVELQGPRDMSKVPPPGFILPDGSTIDEPRINGSGYAWGWSNAEGMGGGGWIIPGTRTFVYMFPAAMTGTGGKGWGLQSLGTSNQGDQYECLAFFYDLAEIKEVADGTRLITDCIPYHYEKMPGVQEDISTGMGRWIGVSNIWAHGNFVSCPVTGNVYGYVEGGHGGPYQFYNPNTGEIDTRSAPYNVATTTQFRNDKKIYIWGANT